VWGQPSQKLAVKLTIVCHPERLAGLSFLIHRDEHGKLLVCITSDKLFHIAAAPPFKGFARSLRKTPLQRFHSIINGSFFDGDFTGFMVAGPRVLCP
jgi:hypothetical protein